MAEVSATKDFRKQAMEEAKALNALIESRQKELRSQALALRTRFYADKPSVFCKRLEQFWKRWRREPKQAMPAR